MSCRNCLKGRISLVAVDKAMHSLSALETRSYLFVPNRRVMYIFIFILFFLNLFVLFFPNKLFFNITHLFGGLIIKQVWLIVLFFNVPPKRFFFFFFSQTGEYLSPFSLQIGPFSSSFHKQENVISFLTPNRSFFFFFSQIGEYYLFSLEIGFFIRV